MQGRRNGFGMGGGQRFSISHFHIKRIQFLHKFICDFQNSLNYEPILALWLYTYLYIVIFKLIIFWLAKYWGGGAIPPPCSYGHGMRRLMVAFILCSKILQNRVHRGTLKYSIFLRNL